MSGAAEAAPRSFSDRVLRLLERVSIASRRRPPIAKRRFDLRFDAYQKNGFLQRSDGDRLYDRRYDDDANAWITTTFIDGELAGTVKGQYRAWRECSPARPSGVCRRARAKTLSRAGHRRIHSTCGAIVVVEHHPELAYVIMRPAFMAAEHFGADCAVGSPREEHIAFYRRVFGATVWRAPRDYPGLTAKLACVGADYRDASAVRRDPLPFFQVRSRGERSACLGRDEDSIGARDWRGFGRELVGLS